MRASLLVACVLVVCASVVSAQSAMTISSYYDDACQTAPRLGWSTISGDGGCQAWAPVATGYDVGITAASVKAYCPTSFGEDATVIFYSDAACATPVYGRRQYADDIQDAWASQPCVGGVRFSCNDTGFTEAIDFPDTFATVITCSSCGDFPLPDRQCATEGATPDQCYATTYRGAKGTAAKQIHCPTSGSGGPSVYEYTDAACTNANILSATRFPDDETCYDGQAITCPGSGSASGPTWPTGSGYIIEKSHCEDSSTCADADCRVDAWKVDTCYAQGSPAGDFSSKKFCGGPANGYTISGGDYTATQTAFYADASCSNLVMVENANGGFSCGSTTYDLATVTCSSTASPSSLNGYVKSYEYDECEAEAPLWTSFWIRPDTCVGGRDNTTQKLTCNNDLGTAQYWVYPNLGCTGTPSVSVSGNQKTCENPTIGSLYYNMSCTVSSPGGGGDGGDAASFLGPSLVLTAFAILAAFLVIKQ